MMVPDSITLDLQIPSLWVLNDHDSNGIFMIFPPFFMALFWVEKHPPFLMLHGRTG